MQTPFLHTKPELHLIKAHLSIVTGPTHFPLIQVSVTLHCLLVLQVPVG